jgi:hypothetical protein
LAFAVSSLAHPLRTKIPTRLFLKDTYRFARSYRLGVVRRFHLSGRTPLMGFISVAPPPTQALCVHFRWPKPSSARRCHSSHAFRPCRFSRLRRLTPRGALRVCCTSLPVIGFAQFPDRVPKHAAVPLKRNTLRSVPLLSSLPLSPELPPFTSVRALSLLRLHLCCLCTRTCGGASGAGPQPQGLAPLKSPLRS